jgi:hypothetical protein
MTQYECRLCGGLVNQEDATVVQRRNMFDNWLGNDYYHQNCYQKYLSRKQAEEAIPPSFFEKHFGAIVGSIIAAPIIFLIIVILWQAGII